MTNAPPGVRPGTSAGSVPVPRVAAPAARPPPRIHARAEPSCGIPTSGRRTHPDHRIGAPLGGGTTHDIPAALLVETFDPLQASFGGAVLQIVIGGLGGERHHAHLGPEALDELRALTQVRGGGPGGVEMLHHEDAGFTVHGTALVRSVAREGGVTALVGGVARGPHASVIPMWDTTAGRGVGRRSRRAATPMHEG
jgi:hypothetical protein